MASYNLKTICEASGIILYFTDEETAAQTGDCLRSRMRGEGPGLGPSLPVPSGPLHASTLFAWLTWGSRSDFRGEMLWEVVST